MSYGSTITSTRDYFDAAFPEDLIRLLLLYPFDKSGDASGGSVFRVVKQIGETDAMEPVDLSSLTPSSASSSVLATDLKKDHRSLSLHWSSPSHRLFSLDLDVDLFGAPYIECKKAHHDPKDVFCSKCWKQLCFAALVCEIVTRCVVAAVFYPGIEIDNESPCAAPVFLTCFSGHRGIHMFAHPALGLHSLGTHHRRVIVDAICNAQADWVDPATVLLIAQKFLGPCVQPWFFDPAGRMPVDVTASVAAFSKKTIRLPFSPHLKSNFVSTPFDLYACLSQSNEYRSLPRFIAVQWKPYVNDTTKREQNAWLGGWRRARQARLEKARHVFATWFASFLDEAEEGTRTAASTSPRAK